MSKFYILLVFIIGISFNSFAIKVERKIFPKDIKPGQSAIVTITINKQGEEGFAKLMESLPEGFIAEELNSAFGNFVFEDGKVRIIWLTMPEGESFVAEYKLIYQGKKIGDFKVDGNFYYLQNDQRSEYKIESSFIKVSEKVDTDKGPVIVPKITTEAIVRDTMVESMLDNEITDEEGNGNQQIVEDSLSAPGTEIKQEDTAVIKTEKPLEETKSEVVFKVQLGVFSAEKDPKVFGDLPEVHFILVGSFYKYYSGNFSSEFEARSTIEKAKSNGFQGAFLVRFKDGQRI